MSEQPTFDVRALKDLLSALQDAVQQGQEKMPVQEQMKLYTYALRLLVSETDFGNRLVYEASTSKKQSGAALYKLSGSLIDEYLHEKVFSISEMRIRAC